MQREREDKLSLLQLLGGEQVTQQACRQAGRLMEKPVSSPAELSNGHHSWLLRPQTHHARTCLRSVSSHLFSGHLTLASLRASMRAAHQGEN